jgi:hypothetical protein
MEWKEVGAIEFYDVMGPLNIHPEIQPGRYPYTALWKTPLGEVRGETVGKSDGTHTYYLPREA